MARSETTLTGRTLEHSQDSASGILTQNPESTQSTAGGLTTPVGQVTDVVFGQEFTVLARAGFGINTPAAATTYRTEIFNADAPFKFRVMEVTLKVVDITAADWTDGDAGSLDFTVIRGDGAESETESDILADQVLDDDYENGETVRYPHATVFLANDTVVSGGSLFVDVVADPDATAGATNDGVILDVEIRCLRVL